MAKRQFYNIFVGAETGLLKGVNTKYATWNNTTNLEKADRQKEIVCLCWNDDYQEELCLGRRDQTVSLYSTSTATIVNELSLKAGEGPFKGLCKVGSDYVTCTESGCLKLWSSASETKLEVNVGQDICFMRNNPFKDSIIGTGGKENELKLWDLNDSSQPLFTAKNVQNDWLNLRVPVWVTDVSFLPGSQQVVTCTNYSQVRLYDPASSARRPQLEVTFDEGPIKCMSFRPNSSHQVVVGNSHGGMALVDFRGKGNVVQRYKGAEGGIRAVACHPTDDVVLSCGLDRYLRIHDINTRQLIHKLYLKSRLNCLLVSNKVMPADENDEIMHSVVASEMSDDDEVINEPEDVLWSKMPEVKTKDIDSKQRNTANSSLVKQSKLKRKPAKSLDDLSTIKKTKTKKKYKA